MHSKFWAVCIKYLEHMIGRIQTQIAAVSVFFCAETVRSSALKKWLKIKLSQDV